MTWNARDRVVFSNISATPASFVLKGGSYGIEIIAGSWTSVTLQRLAADGTTYVAAVNPFTGNSCLTVWLPDGTYQLAVTSTTGIYADITSIEVPLA